MAKRRSKKTASRTQRSKPPVIKAPAAKGKGEVASWSPPAAPASPFTLMRRFADEMDRVFEDFRHGLMPQLPRLGSPFEGWKPGEMAWTPSVEVAERGGKLVVHADLPGLTKKDVKVEVREGAVCIQGERRRERETKRKGVYRSERSYGSFYREIPLPEGIDIEQATASFRNGVLEVTLPAPPPAAKGRKVTVEGD
jgi:HSP20 family protein